MTEPIDHAGKAQDHLARIRGVWAEMEGRPFPSPDAAAITASLAVNASVANAEAVLAVVAAQDRANELKRIEILAILAKTEQADIAEAMDGPGGARPSILSGQAGAALFDWDGDLKPSIAASLGLGGESK